MKRKIHLRWAGCSLAIAGCLPLVGCLNQQVIKHPLDMFSIYDGRPTAATEREQALNDCYTYNGSLGIDAPAAQANQICMLQLGFRAPNGELLGLMSTAIQAGSQGCVGDAGDPVCWAAKYGWPQDPPPRWAKPGADPDDLGNAWYVCFSSYAGVYPYAAFTAKVDRCMAQKYGYTVVHPHSPAVPWLPHKYWPNCAKPADQRNWIERKWCPPGPAARPTTPDSEVRGRPRTSSRAS